MVSRRWFAIIMAIVSLGLIGPLVFISQQSAVEATPTPVPTPVPTPMVLGQVLTYTAEVEAEIAYVQPILVIAFMSDLPEANLSEALSTLENATLYGVDGSGPYTASIVLDSPELAQPVLGQLQERGLAIMEYGLPAEITLPASFTAYRNGVGTKMSLGTNDQLSALVSGNTLSGSAMFALEITRSGGTKSIVALEIA